MIEETLDHLYRGRLPASGAELARALSGAVADRLWRIPTASRLARWAEAEFGVEREAGGELRRRMPRTLADRAASRLAEAGTWRKEICEQRLRELLTWAASCPATMADAPSPSSCTSSSARAGRCSPRSNPPRPREFSLEGQVQAGGGRLFVPGQVLPPLRPGLLPRHSCA